MDLTYTPALIIQHCAVNGRDAQLLHLVKEGAQWRHKPRSDKQEALAQRLGIRIQADWRCGDLADAITAVTGEWYDAVT